MECSRGFIAKTTWATDLYVGDCSSPSPSDFSIIQDAVNGSAANDTIKICPDTYTEHVMIPGKTLSLIGIDGAEATIVDGGGQDGPVFSISQSSILSFESLTVVQNARQI